MQWELNTDKPVYLQLVEQIQAGIISGKYKPGDKLPSVRDLATQASKPKYNAKSYDRARAGWISLF